jgi:hypothetical protein
MSTQAAFSSSVATSLVTTAETAVLTFTTAPEQQPTGQGLYIDVNAVVNTGAAATAVQVRIRQGAGTAGALVGVVAQTQVAASTANEIAGCAAVDPQTSYPAGNTYTVTVQQVAATGNGTMAQVTASVAPVTALAG